MTFAYGYAQDTEQRKRAVRQPATPVGGSAGRSDRFAVDVCEDESAALDLLLERIDGRGVALVTDHTVARLHARRLAERLRSAGVQVQRTSSPAGEGSKSIATAISLLDWFDETQVTRRDVVVAMGGGVVIETVGWAAGAYMRGVPYCNVPTTLLAQVDATPGGEAAFDAVARTSLIGTLHQPMAAVSNVGYLSSLDRRRRQEGLAEAVNRGIALSPQLFELVEEQHAALVHAEPAVTARLVRDANLIGTRLSGCAQHETRRRRPLDLGHAIGRAVETVTGCGPVLRGEAVAFGTACAARIAAQRRLLDPDTLTRVTGLFQRVGLPTTLDTLAATPDPAAIVSALSQTLKLRDGHLRFVLPAGLGETVITDEVSDEEITAALVGGRGLGPATSVDGREARV